MMSDSFDTIEEQEQEIVRVAHRLLSGEVSIIEGSREMTRVHFRSHSDERDEEFLTFIGIASETDHLPVGDVRRHWAEDALVLKDTEITEAEEFFRERAIKAARILIHRYERL